MGKNSPLGSLEVAVFRFVTTNMLLSCRLSMTQEPATTYGSLASIIEALDGVEKGRWRRTLQWRGLKPDIRSVQLSQQSSRAGGNIGAFILGRGYHVHTQSSCMNGAYFG